ncbi:FecR family protein [Chitinophagaceae bacterium LWZ2-11]
MALTTHQIEELYNKYLQNRCTPEELQILLNELEGSQTFQYEQVKQLFDKTWDSIEVYPGEYPLAESSFRKKEIQKAVVVKINMRRKLIFRFSAAAALLLLITGIFFYYNNHTPAPIAETVNTNSNDQAPGGNKALLTLADGSTIILDGAANGKIAEQGNTKVIKLSDGRLAYNQPINQTNSTAVLYNKIATPRGGQYRLTLPDGSNVWLNATSSLHFPNSFTGPERKVQLTGEAYFEVTKDKEHPFIVEFGKSSVQVLGTEFNIMAYDDEPNSKTTLVTGSVLLQATAQKAILKPGETGTETATGIHLSNADIEQVTAWKEGRLSLNNADISSLMRQISRWYDVDIEYKGAIPDKRIGGFVDRSVNLSAVLKALDEYGIHCTLIGKKIVVS